MPFVGDHGDPQAELRMLTEDMRQVNAGHGVYGRDEISRTLSQILGETTKAVQEARSNGADADT
jgi:hypothetical protein